MSNKIDFVIENVSDIETLFDQWKATHRNESDESYRAYCSSNAVPKDAFLPDGIIDGYAYKNSKSKILFIAKEANWYNPETDNAEVPSYSGFWLHDVVKTRLATQSGGSNFSRRLALLASAALKEDNTYAALQKCAFMNLNKRGGFKSCVWNTLEGYVSQYRDFIRREIELINPDLIICCGSGVKWLLEKYECSPNKIRVIAVCHPSYFGLSDEEYRRQLDCAIKEIPWTPSAKQSDLSYQSAEQKGIIFDTNKTYSASATFEMLTGNKVSVYCKKPGFLNCFQLNDLVFYYIKARGIVAVGEIISDEQIAEDDSDERYKTVRMIIPETIPMKEECLASISPCELKELMNRENLVLRGTVKRPYLNKQECETILARLKEKYHLKQALDISRENYSSR